MYISEKSITSACGSFRGAAPFDHCVIDDFFLPEVASQLAEEFPNYDDSCWHVYDNAIEVKKTCNNWNLFLPLTYRVFSYLNSPEFLRFLGAKLAIAELAPDPGLNGGGWHIHRPGGKLNPHLDYNIHPKLAMQRKLNIIIYLNREWRADWGGQLGLWQQSAGKRAPGQLIQSIDPLFNRAVVFDTTQNSWHGLTAPVSCPPGRTRNSLAVYYLVPSPEGAEDRGKALFSPTADQEGDKEILDLIERRARTDLASSVYNREKG